MKKKGISLITLIITIIVIIILAGVIIFSISKNNPVDKANEAVFKQNLATYKDELEMYHLNEISKNNGDYDRKTLNKDESNIKEVIKSMKEEDTKKFEIVEGELVYKGDKEEEKEWTEEVEEGKTKEEKWKEKEDKIEEEISKIKENPDYPNIPEEDLKKVISNIGEIYDCNPVIYKEPTLLGDIDGNDKITIADAILVLEYYVGNVEFTEAQKTQADYDRDGKIDTKDALAVLDSNGYVRGYINSCEEKDPVSKNGINVPQLVAGMTPIVWDASGNVVETTKDDEKWYDYENKKWANAKTADGSFWVWIPRYEYKEFTKGSTAQVIDVKFVDGITKTSTSGYTMHPGFTFGTDELPGIWVAKFEATAREGVSNSTAGDNVTTKNVKISPNVSSWRYISIGNMFDVALKMKDDATYGWSADKARMDTHLMKNVEWGAVAYLSSSKYGKTGEVWINPNSDYITGQAGESVSASYTTTTYAYNTENGVNASTTGTVYGVYDMSGGAWEYTAAYVDNGHGNLTTYGKSLVNAVAKYKDVYAKGGEDTREANYGANSSKKGDAVYETSLNGSGGTSWYGDYSYMPSSNLPFFARGGSCYNGTYAGVFYFSSDNGYGLSYSSFRPVLAVSVAL